MNSVTDSTDKYPEIRKRYSRLANKGTLWKNRQKEMNSYGKKDTPAYNISPM